MERCWASQLADDCGSFCNHGFKSKKGSIGKKVCNLCKARAFSVPACNVIPLQKEHSHIFVNRGHGLWNVIPDHFGTGYFRVINNTLGCQGPKLIVFRNGSAQNMDDAQLPSEWVTDGMVQLRFCRSTFVPNAPIALVKNTRGNSKLTVCDPVDGRNVIEVPGWFSYTCGETEDSESWENFDNEQKIYKEKKRSADKLVPLRTLRNREAAALSRERKRKYIECLESQVAVLEATMEKLKDDNSRLRLCLDFFDESRYESLEELLLDLFE